MNAERTSAKGYCNVLALQKGLDPAGTAGDFDDAIILETPLPWKKNIYSEPGALPKEMIQLLEQWLERYRAGEGYRHRPLMIAPDAEYSRPGYRRVMFYKRQPGLFAEFHKVEYLVPEDEAGALAWALYNAPEQLPRFEQYRDQQNDMTRDLLVCTHGTVDSACAKFGYPLFNLLRRQYANDNLRTWRVSHFGGHVFAPTLIDMPVGHYWGYVEPEQAEAIVRRSGSVEAMRGHYRGWAGLGYGFAQAAERELWQRHGWAWFDYLKHGTTLAQDDTSDEPQWGDVRIEYVSPDGREQGMYDVRVEVTQRIETIVTTGNDYSYAHPQYTVTSVEAGQQKAVVFA